MFSELSNGRLLVTWKVEDVVARAEEGSRTGEVGRR